VQRHLEVKKRKFWHIDYLSGVAETRAVFYQVTRMKLECVWSQSLFKAGIVSIPIPGFGSSDCSSRCPAHFVMLATGMTASDIHHHLSLSAGSQLKSLVLTDDHHSRITG
jgi:Uri superfamily endonuclease